MSDPASSPAEVTPWQCLIGSSIAAGFGFMLYQLTASIAATFATKPGAQNSYLAANIGVAVRTLVVGACSLGTFIFILSAVGLFALGIQTLVRQTHTKT
jgi:hypothetical protein